MKYTSKVKIPVHDNLIYNECRECIVQGCCTKVCDGFIKFMKDAYGLSKIMQVYFVCCHWTPQQIYKHYLMNKTVKVGSKFFNEFIDYNKLR